MSPSKGVLRANLLKSIQEDHRRELKSRAGPVDNDLVAYRRRRCRHLGHYLRKDIQCFTDTPDDGRWFVECLLPHPGDVTGDGGVHIYVSRRLDPEVLQELRDHVFARRLQAQQLLPTESRSEPSVRSQSPGRDTLVHRSGRAPRMLGSPRRPYPTSASPSPRTFCSVLVAPSGHSSPDVPRRSSPKTAYIEISDSESDTTSRHVLGRRSRSPSLEILTAPSLYAPSFTVWLFMEQDAPPQAIDLKILSGAEEILLRDYDQQWEKVGLKVSERVKILAAYSQKEPLWQFGRLCDIRIPVRARAIVLAHVNIDHYHALLRTLFRHAFTGGFSHGMA
ncbi:unnamed protein product [Peniophora sp. CBMAI 1063]|nr:unnamed protein product [Peniophora sp. CBMAI 1063]